MKLGTGASDGVGNGVGVAAGEPDGRAVVLGIGVGVPRNAMFAVSPVEPSDELT